MVTLSECDTFVYAGRSAAFCSILFNLSKMQFNSGGLFIRELTIESRFLMFHSGQKIFPKIGNKRHVTIVDHE